MQNVRGCQETNEPEKLYYETQKDNWDRSQGEIKKELQKSQPSHLEERGEEQLERLGTIREDERKPNTVQGVLEK
jgi:hypothetical protein